MEGFIHLKMWERKVLQKCLKTEVVCPENNTLLGVPPCGTAPAALRPDTPEDSLTVESNNNNNNDDSSGHLAHLT